MFSFKRLIQLKQELNLTLLENYDDKTHYIGKTKIRVECIIPDCDAPVEISFIALERSKYPCCKKHSYASRGAKMAISISKKNKPIYDENRRQLYRLTQDLGIELIGNYSVIDIKSDTDIHYRCAYENCDEIDKKHFHTLLENRLFYCITHHYLIHNSKINSQLRIQNQDTYNRYNGILDNLKKKYPTVELTWDRDTIYSQSELVFNCINPNCKVSVCKLFQHILQNETSTNEVYFGCEECKFYISESLREDAILLINTPYYSELIEHPKQINYITTHSGVELKWTCRQVCINCKTPHIYISSPYYRFVQWKPDCPLCLDPNKCGCINDGFICNMCVSYFPDRQNKMASGNICRPCKSKQNDDNLEKILKRAIDNCISICKNRKGNRRNMDLDLEYLVQLYQSQNGLCTISKIPMSLKVHSDFKISIERIDETNGYVKGNICFICIEFQNGQQQWSFDKFNDFCNKYYNFQSITETDKENVKKLYNESLIKNTKHFKPRKTQQSPYNNIETKQCLCRSCDTVKLYDQFSEYGLKNGRCRDCHKILNAKRNTPSLRLKLNIIISGSKGSIKKRNKSKWRKDQPLEHTLTFEELLNIYLQQNGRCAYSNRPLELTGEYMMSLERNDTAIGYTKENCCLICIEFNTTDWSCAKCYNDNREGSSGWNKEKLKTVVDNYLRNI
uniref:Uncharacterized protein n=1 Tax=viral metagenome TaxID=1070528 RepID=A0A6C0JYG3_9ZZZZ